MKPFRTSPEAKRELREAIDHYEAEEPGLGLDFLDEYESALARIRQLPDGWALVDMTDGVRRCQLNRFPYGVIYSQLDDAIQIISVLHLHRDPGTWRGRG